MPPQTAQTLLSAEQFQALPDNGRDQELMRGEIHEMPKPGERHSDLFNAISFFLNWFIREHGGVKVLPECGFLLERDPDTVRAPDVAVVPTGDAKGQVNPKFSRTTPTIVVEINSPNDIASEILDKARWWLGHGVEQVWIVDDPTRTVTVYYPDGSAQMLGEDQTLDAGHALPGFTLPLTNLFAT